MFILVLSIQVFGWRLGVQVATPNLPFMWDVRVVKVRTWIALVFSVHGGLRIQRGCQQATLWEWLCGCAQEVLRFCWSCFSQGGEREGDVGSVFFSAVPPLDFGIPPCSGELSPLSCGAVLLERGCVSLCVRVSSAVRLHWVGFKDCMFH